METKDKLLTALNQALLKKQESCSYYEYLADSAPEQRMREVSRRILVSEKQHLDLLTSLLNKLQQDKSHSADLDEAGSIITICLKPLPAASPA